MLVKHYVTDLGFTYLSASCKEEFASVVGEFLSADSPRSIVLECFVEKSNDVAAFKDLLSLPPKHPSAPPSLKSSLASHLPPTLKKAIRKMF